MSRTKKAVQVLQHQDGSGQQTTLPGFDLSNQDHITVFTPAQDSVASFLGRGQGNALTTREIAQISGLSPRDVTRAICFERRHGAPILSDPGAGFWLAASEDELRRCVAALRRRAAEIQRTASALERTAGGG